MGIIRWFSFNVTMRSRFLKWMILLKFWNWLYSNILNLFNISMMLKNVLFVDFHSMLLSSLKVLHHLTSFLHFFFCIFGSFSVFYKLLCCSWHPKMADLHFLQLIGFLIFIQHLCIILLRGQIAENAKNYVKGCKVQVIFTLPNISAIPYLDKKNLLLYAWFCNCIVVWCYINNNNEKYSYKNHVVFWTRW